MTMMNKKGDKGSPCQRLRAWQMRCPGHPLMSTLVLAVASMAEIQSRHRSGKPMCPSTSSKKGHGTVSKAFARSTLRRTVGQRRAYSQRQMSYTVRKFS
jgi:hypothetical protein